MYERTKHSAKDSFPGNLGEQIVPNQNWVRLAAVFHFWIGK